MFRVMYYCSGYYNIIYMYITHEENYEREDSDGKKNKSTYWRQTRLSIYLYIYIYIKYYFFVIKYLINVIFFMEI